MAITVGDLRTFCEEQASPNSAGATADREAMKWINSALTRLYKAAPWDRLVREEKRLIYPKESVTAVLGLTQASLTITRSSGLFLQKYIDGRWELKVDGYERGTFELSALGAPASSATLRTGDEWPEATTLVATGHFLYTRIPIPLAKNVTRVRVVETGAPVTLLTPTQFDLQKDYRPQATSNDPLFCCFRRGNLEFWPHPGDNYRKLSITYHISFTQIPDDELDATEVEWDEAQLDLLHKALLVEAAITQGEAAVVPYVVALREYEAALKGDKDYMQRQDMTGRMGVEMPETSPARLRRVWTTNTEAGADIP